MVFAIVVMEPQPTDHGVYGRVLGCGPDQAELFIEREGHDRLVHIALDGTDQVVSASGGQPGLCRARLPRSSPSPRRDSRQFWRPRIHASKAQQPRRRWPGAAGVEVLQQVSNLILGPELKGVGLAEPMPKNELLEDRFNDVHSFRAVRRLPIRPGTGVSPIFRRQNVGMASTQPFTRNTMPPTIKPPGKTANLTITSAFSSQPVQSRAIAPNTNTH